MSVVTFLGMGAMGQRMAANLLRAGYALHVWNRSPDRCAKLIALGAIPHATPCEAVRQADFVITMLRDDQAVRDVWLDQIIGALVGLRTDTVAIECSTLSLERCIELGEAVRSRGAGFLDAPVVGSRPQAESRQLIHLVGGSMETLERARSVLEVNASAIHRVGDVGSGMAMKLAVNALFGIQVAALGELFGFLDRCRIEASQVAELLAQLPVTSPAAKGAAAAMATKHYAPLFPVALVHKDFRYAVESAQARNAELPTTAFVGDLFARAIQEGYGDENLHAVAKLFNTH